MLSRHENLKRKIAITALILIIGIVGTEVYATSLKPTSTQEAEPQIVSHTTYLEIVENITFYTVAGVVQNNLNTNIKSVDATATFYDKTNNRVGIRHSPTVLDILEPGQRAPFEIFLTIDPETTITDISYELILSYEITQEKPITGLVILNHTPSVDMNGFYQIRGEVQNTESRKAFSVVMICTYFDSENNLLAVSRAHISSSMESGEKAFFDISSDPHEINPASYELLIVVHHYELLIVTYFPLFVLLIIPFPLFVVYMKRYRGW